MTLQQPTIEKLFREHFKENNPIRGTVDELKELGKTVEQRIKRMKNVSINERHYFHSEEKRKRLK